MKMMNKLQHSIELKRVLLFYKIKHSIHFELKMHQVRRCCTANDKSISNNLTFLSCLNTPWISLLSLKRVDWKSFRGVNFGQAVNTERFTDLDKHEMVKFAKCGLVRGSSLFLYCFSCLKNDATFTSGQN